MVLDFYNVHGIFIVQTLLFFFNVHASGFSTIQIILLDLYSTNLIVTNYPS